MTDSMGRGITVTEMTAMDEPVDVRSHSVAAFVGRALRGPLDTPVLLRSFAHFCRRFGGSWSHSTLGPAVQQFFEHGGKRLYVVRVANSARGAMLCLPADHGVLVLRALEPGSTERIRVSIDYDGLPADDHHFNLTVQRVSPTTSLVIDQEIYMAVSCREESRRYVGDVLLDSSLVRVRLPAPPGRPLATVGPQVDYESLYIEHAQRGTDGNELTDYDIVGSAAARTGLFALEAVDRFDLLYLPPNGRHRDVGPAALMAAELYCRKRGAMLVTDPPASWVGVPDAISGIRTSGFSGPNVLTYFPRMNVHGEPTITPRPVGASIAGLLCRLDDQVGPWQDLDQAGYGLHRRFRPAVAVTAAEASMLVREGVNVIAGSTAGRATVCGSVTLARTSGLDRRFESLPLRRLCLHITNTVERATRWAVFDAGGRSVAELVRAQVHAFMAGLAGQGAFDAAHFDVQCEPGLHPERQDAHRGVTILISFRPVDSAAYVRMTLHQTVQGCRVSSTAFAPAIAACA